MESPSKTDEVSEPCRKLAIKEASSQNVDQETILSQNISEISKIRLMRERYKAETQAYLDDELQVLLEREKCIKQDKADKLQLLVQHNKQILDEMSEQRVATGNRIEQLVKVCSKIAGHQSVAKNAAESMSSMEDAIKTLLAELKK